jgi:hypothetical protein
MELSLFLWSYDKKDESTADYPTYEDHIKKVWQLIMGTGGRSIGRCGRII